MDFKTIIEEESQKEYFIKLQSFLDEQYKSKTIFPERKNIFASLEHTPFDKIKVVIIGQDPYHGEGEAHGFAFSVNPGINIPPSLKNIYKELNQEYGCNIPNNGYLMKWANQGVLLLNTILTVEKDKPLSHKNKGWEVFTDRILQEINKKSEPVVFMLWGNWAKSKKDLIRNKNHLILESPHPSPFSARHGFFGNNHFKLANKFLAQNGIESIDWQIENI